MKSNIIQTSVYVSYAQMSVFCAELENPFNDWTERHVNQGFSWRPQSVSFKMLEECGETELSIFIGDRFKYSEDAIRVIRVPFQIENVGNVEIASITSGFQLNIPKGDYDLFFEQGFTDDRQMWGRMHFVAGMSSSAKIIKCDDGLTPQEPLLMLTESA